MTLKLSRLETGAALAAAIVVSATGCASRDNVQMRLQQAGSLALSADGKQLFVADQDGNGVAVVDPQATSGSLAFIPTGSRPERLILRGNDLFVANRFSRTVTQLDAASRKVVKQIAVGAEPMGLEVSNDGRTLYVAHATNQSLMAIDVASGGVKWHALLNDEVRSVAVLPDGRLYVPGYKSGVMHVVDARGGTVLSSFTFAQPGQSGPPNGSTPPPRLPTSVEDIHVGADGRVYLAHSQSIETLADPAQPVVTTNYYCLTPWQRFGPSVAPGYTAISPENDQLLGDQKGLPPTALAPSSAYAGPKVAAFDPSGGYMYSVNYLSQNVGVVPLGDNQLSAENEFDVSSRFQAQVPQIVQVGNGPNGIAIAPEGHRLYVYNSFDHSISVVASDDASGQLNVTNTIQSITAQTLTASQQHGRILFHSASYDTITIPATGGVSCASCHPNGREDGMTWQFAEGTRNTPSLVGKHLELTAPYHWDGAFSDFDGINHVVQKRMGGAGLSPDDFNDLMEYLKAEPAPDNPNRAADGTLTDQQQQGKALFEGKAGCATCHTGEALTDNASYDVGTDFTTIPLSTLDDNPVVQAGEQSVAKPNTPSLLGIFATAPYLHNGKALTLEARVRDDRNGQHGHTGDLTDGEIASLVAYLKAL